MPPVNPVSPHEIRQSRHTTFALHRVCGVSAARRPLCPLGFTASPLPPPTSQVVCPPDCGGFTCVSNRRRAVCRLVCGAEVTYSQTIVENKHDEENYVRLEPRENLEQHTSITSVRLIFGPCRHGIFAKNTCSGFRSLLV